MKRNDATRALWEASDKSDKAKAFIKAFLAEHSTDQPGGAVADAALAVGLKKIRRAARRSRRWQRSRSTRK